MKRVEPYFYFRVNHFINFLLYSQIGIDELAYEMYNLNEDDMNEFENRYFKRYLNLAKVIEEKIDLKDQKIRRFTEIGICLMVRGKQGEWSCG